MVNTPESKIKGHLKREKKIITGTRAAVITFLLLLWEFAGESGWITLSALHSPIEFVQWIIQRSKQDYIIYHATETLTTVVLSWFAGVTAAIFCAALLWVSTRAVTFSRPLIKIMEGVPFILIVPLVLVLPLDTDVKTGIASGLIVFFYVSLHVFDCYKRINPDYVKIFSGLGLQRGSLFASVIFPASYPMILKGLKASTSLAWTGVLIGEFINNSKGLGHLIMMGFQHDRIESVVLPVLIVFILSGLLYRLIFWCLEKSIFARPFMNVLVFLILGTLKF